MDNKPLLLVSDSLLKGKGNRDGLVQQVITYVRDGRTITRKQWVRSEFADHAKKNEEERRKAVIRQMEKDRRKHEKSVRDSKEKQEAQDRKSKRKMESKHKEDKDKLSANAKDKTLQRYHKEAKKREKEDKEDKEKQDKTVLRNNKESSSTSKKKREDSLSSYGKQDYTRADNKQATNLATQYSTPAPKTQS